MVEEIKTDVLVAGGGMGGLMAAMRAHSAGAQVVLLTGTPGASIRMAGFSTALCDFPEDRPEHLFNDMFIGGGFINNPLLLAALAQRIGPETRFFEELGVPFETRQGKLARRQAAGVSRPRAVFTTDMVGVDVGKRLLKRLRAAAMPDVRVIDRALLLDLDIRDGAVAGGLAYLQREDTWLHIQADSVVIATGGVGQLYARTSNFGGSQATGYALALEAGASLVDMEFVSFEPTVAFAPAKIAGKELPTMAFFEGARLLNGRGEEFIETKLAPSKDVICRAMLREVRDGRGTPNGGIYYDLRQVSHAAISTYTQMRQVLKALNVTPEEALIEVAPTQHFMMGGIQTDEGAATAVDGLFAVGEVAGGAHGAHRLATCGGTEAIAMGAIAGEGAARHAQGKRARAGSRPQEPKPELLFPTVDVADLAIISGIRNALEDGCGVLRDAEGLDKALHSLYSIQDQLIAQGRLKTFVGRSVRVALAIAQSASMRTESRGDHFRIDYPYRDDCRWLGNLFASLSGQRGSVALEFRQAEVCSRTPAVPMTR